MAELTGKAPSGKTRNLIIVFVVIAVVAGLIYFYFMGDTDKERTAAKVPRLSTTAEYRPGADKLSKEYLQILLESDRQAAQAALQEGRSSVPTIITTGVQYQLPGEALASGDIDPCLKQCVDCCRGRAATPARLMNQWVKEGKMSPVAAAELSQLQDKGASVEEYASTLNRLVKEGKLTPEQAKELLTAYRGQQKQPETAADSAVNDLLGTGEISAQAAAALKKLNTRGKSVKDYENDIQRMVREGKITPEQAQKLINAYRVEKGAEAVASIATPDAAYDQLVGGLVAAGTVSPDVAKKLAQLKQQSVSAADYATQLNQLVQEGKLSPEAAQKLLVAYSKATPAVVDAALKGTPLEQLQRTQQQQALQQQQIALQKAAAQRKQQEEILKSAQVKQELQSMQNAMGGQAKALFASWNAVPQTFVGTPPQDESDKDKNGKSKNGTKTNGRTGDQTSSADGEKQFPLIKSGSIMFGVLDTGINSDRPGPVMATVVSGKLKGAKLMGTLTQTPDQERVMLQFNILTMPNWPDSVKINAFAINPNTARTAIASDVDHHYFLRYSSVFASSFLAGFSKAVQTSGATIKDTSSGEETSSAKLNTGEKVMVGLGEVGTKLSDVAKQYFKRPTTVTVDAGVGIGLLFMDDVFHQPTILNGK